MRRLAAVAAAVAGLTLTTVTPAFAGPPWISIELPANPYNAATRDAFCLVRVYHHGDAAYYPVSGSAEGLIGGDRRSQKLSLKETGIPGVYAVNYQPTKDGTWLLLFRIGTDKEYGGATVVVQLNRQGQIASAQVPTRTDEREGYRIPTRVTAADVDRMLREQVAQASHPGHDGSPWAMAGLALAPLALIARRRLR